VTWSGCPFPTSLSSQSHLFTPGLPSNPSCLSLSPSYPSSCCFDSQNSMSVSPFPATLTNHISRKSFACHSCKKHPGWGSGEQALACSPDTQPLTLDPRSPSFAAHLGAAPALLSAPLPVTSLSSLKSTPTKYPAGADSKPLTESLKPLDATFTKNSGEGTSSKWNNLRRIALAFVDPERAYQPWASAFPPSSQPALSLARPSQYNPLFAHRGGIRHGHGRSENSHF
jgi:hypothetical protein